jgi:hypothetical protein
MEKIRFLNFPAFLIERFEAKYYQFISFFSLSQESTAKFVFLNKYFLNVV